MVGERGITEGNLMPSATFAFAASFGATASLADCTIPSGTEVQIINAERMELTVRIALT